MYIQSWHKFRTTPENLDSDNKLNTYSLVKLLTLFITWMLHLFSTHINHMHWTQIFQKNKYFVRPLPFVTARKHFDMSSTILWQYSADNSFTTSFIAFSSTLALVNCFSETLCFKRVHKFSIGFKVGLFLGQSSVWIFCHQLLSNNFRAMTWCTILPENYAFVNGYV